MTYEDGKYYYRIHGEWFDVCRYEKVSETSGIFHPIERKISYAKARAMVYELNGWNKDKNDKNESKAKETEK